MDQRSVFVLAWVTAEGEPMTPMGQGGRVLFVEHPKRGWEIPGGHLEENESPEAALLRELKEETGLEGVIRHWHRSYYPEGWVAHVEVKSTKCEAWKVNDINVATVQWWYQTPPVIAWTKEEFEELASYFSSV